MATFRAWAMKQGLPLDLTPHEGPRFKQTIAGRHLATFLDDATEGAWRAWAHLSLARIGSEAPAPAERPYSDAGWTSGHGLPSTDSQANPNAGWTSGA